MLDGRVGAVIMVVATTALLYSIELAESAFDQAGRYQLNSDEREILKKAGFKDEELNQFWKDNIIGAPGEVGLDE